MLIALAFGNNSANTQSCHNDNNGQVTTQDTGGGINPGDGTGGPVGGNTGQTPPPFTKP